MKPACSARIRKPSTASTGNNTSAVSTQLRVTLVSRCEYLSTSTTTVMTASPSLDFDDAAHPVVAHAAEFEAEHAVGPGLVERHPQPIHVARHRLRLREETSIGGVDAEPVVDVERRDAELHRRA